MSLLLAEKGCSVSTVGMWKVYWRYIKRLPFLPEMVYIRVRVWTSGEASPFKTLLSTSPPPLSVWKMYFDNRRRFQKCSDFTLSVITLFIVFRHRDERYTDSIIIPLIRYFTILGQENGQNMRAYCIGESYLFSSSARALCHRRYDSWMMQGIFQTLEAEILENGVIVE